jgi:hypothetical protein
MKRAGRRPAPTGVKKNLCHAEYVTYLLDCQECNMIAAYGAIDMNCFENHISQSEVYGHRSPGKPSRYLMLTFSEIKQRIEQLGDQIDAPTNLMPTYGTSKNDGTPHIEVSDSSYFYRALERDMVCINRKTSSIDELLFWVYQDVTFNMACSYELAHRDSKVNSRKVIFSYQLGLLSLISIEWKERREDEIAEILKEHPY